jgi:eukaryotic-like serine/threonine-protein kinase
MLLDRIAVGGMAEVFVAVRRGDPSGHLYAVKRILPTLAADEDFITMFLDEARLVVQLDHPAIVPLHELGIHDGGYYIAMDYLPGRDLRALLVRLRSRQESLPVPLVAYVGARVADALDHAHRQRGADGAELRVVHRDVSPANVLLGFDGSVRVIDFGIAQAALRTRRQDTVLRGKFGYMTPEMVRGQPVDRRSDVFALGVVLHEMLTGARLFAGRSELSVLERVRRAEVPPPSRARPDLPPDLEEVVLRALAREPADRYAWASELRDALLPFAEGGVPAGDPPALARTMARSFARELHQELDRIERVRVAPPPGPPGPEPAPERTQVIAVGPGEARGAAAAPLFPSPDRTAEPPAAAHRPGRVATLVAVALVTGALALAATRRPPSPAGPAATTGRLLVQARVTARFALDGVAQPPALGAGELRAVDVPAGEHRIELTTADGRRASATLQIRAGETAELLGVALE